MFLCVSVQFSDQGLAAISSDADEIVGRQLAAFWGTLKNAADLFFYSAMWLLNSTERC